MRINVSGLANKTPLHGSPTQQLKIDILYALYQGVNLSAIDKLVIVDDTGAERDYSADLMFYPETPTLRIVASIQASESYTAQKVRAYSGDKVYFETALEQARPLTPSDILNVTLNINFSLTGQAEGCELQTESGYLQLIPLLIDALQGALPSLVYLKISTVQFEVILPEQNYAPDYISATPTLELASDYSQLSIYAEGSYSGHFHWRSVGVLSAQGQTLWSYRWLEPPEFVAGAVVLRYTDVFKPQW